MTATAIRVSPVTGLSLPRVGAWSASLTIHLIILALLLSGPVAYRLTRPVQRDESIPIRIIEDRKPVAVVEELAPPPQMQRQRSAVRHPVAPPPVADDPTATKQMQTISDVPADPAGPAADHEEIGSALPSDTAPTAIAYGTRTAVPYPRDSLKMREQGTVILRVLVDVDGKVIDVQIEKTSGSPRLDRAARDAVKAWSFNPARHGGVAESAWARVPISFNLSTL